MTQPEVGVVVVSRAGHDKGGAFVIIGRADELHVLLCDGQTRKLARPKKKKLRHLHVEPVRIDPIAEALGQERLTDADIRKALRANGYNLNATIQEG